MRCFLLVPILFNLVILWSKSLLGSETEQWKEKGVILKSKLKLISIWDLKLDCGP